MHKHYIALVSVDDVIERRYLWHNDNKNKQETYKVEV